MTMKIYRFRSGAPFDDAELAVLTGDPVASVFGQSGGTIVDLLVDDSREDDLMEIMAGRDFTFVQGDPVRMRTHDFFSGLESPARGSIIVAAENGYITGRPMITDDETGLIMIEDPDQGTIMITEAEEDDGGGAGGNGSPNAVTEFDRANITAIAKTLIYTGEILTQVLLYADAAKTALNYTKNLLYTGDFLTSVQLIRALDAAVFTKTLSYDGGDKLDDVVQT